MSDMRIPSGGLRITALEIRNLWGVAEAVIKPGQRNIIRGRNATGKTSVLKAIELALGGGTLGKYQRLGSDGPPEIVLEISGPTDSIRIEREGDKPPKVLRRVGQSEAFEKVPQPASFLKGLFDTRGANPFLFLQASDDERAQLLLEALEVEMDESQLASTLGEDATLTTSIPANLHPLTRLALIHDAIYSARRGCNVDADGKQKAVEQLKRSVPAEKIPDLGAEIQSREADVLKRSEDLAREIEQRDGRHRYALNEINADRKMETENLERELKANHDSLMAEFELWAASLRAETEKRILGRQNETQRQLTERSRSTGEKIKAAQSNATKRIAMEVEERERLRQSENSATEALIRDREELATLRAQQAEAARHENTRTQIAEFEKAFEGHRADSERLTGVLKGLEALKRSLAEKLPIPGLDISGKEIRVNGVPWRDLNKAQKGAIAGKVAVERAKRSKLPIVFFDEAEQFDQEHLDAIAEVVCGAGAQLFAAVVMKEGEISVEADGAPGGTVKIEAPADPTIGGAA